MSYRLATHIAELIAKRTGRDAKRTEKQRSTFINIEKAENEDCQPSMLAPASVEEPVDADNE